MGAWENARERAGQWWSATRNAAAAGQHSLSWQGFEEWQERHWRGFEERQRRRLGELTDEGQQAVQHEIQAFETWQQRFWAQQGSRQQPTCPNCRLTFLMLPLLPSLRESYGRFFRRSKVLAQQA